MKSYITMLAVAFLYMTAYAQKNPAALTNAYLGVKDALIKSDSKQAATLSAAWLKTIEAETTFKEKAGLIKAVQKISKTTDIEAQRSAFAEASLLMWPVIKNAHHDHRDMYYMFCPMKQSYWISADPEIRNPYYGSVMLTCGNIADKKQ
jgi:hypothetical protein